MSNEAVEAIKKKLAEQDMDTVFYDFDVELLVERINELEAENETQAKTIERKYEKLDEQAERIEDLEKQLVLALEGFMAGVKNNRNADRKAMREEAEKLAKEFGDECDPSYDPDSDTAYTCGKHINIAASIRAIKL